MEYEEKCKIKLKEMCLQKRMCVREYERKSHDQSVFAEEGRA
jgi:hypothetical protein